VLEEQLPRRVDDCTSGQPGAGLLASGSGGHVLRVALSN